MNDIQTECIDCTVNYCGQCPIYEQFKQNSMKQQNDLFELFSCLNPNAVEEENLSECCGAPIIHHDICSDCKEHI